MRERMLRGELYIADDPVNAAEFGRVHELLVLFNGAAPSAWDVRDGVLRQMLRHVGERVVVRAPFYCEYGGTVVGAGAVVTRDLPTGVVAAGVPARALREIGERDRVEALRRST